MSIRSKVEELKNRYERESAIKSNIEKTINDYNSSIEKHNSQIELCDKSYLILSNVSLEAKKSVITFLEDVVTDAIKFISEGQYRFQIEIDDSNKTTKCEFYIIEKIGEEESKQRPEDACGGGFVDIISTTLRYAYLNLYNAPTLRGPMILDEPGKMISSEMSVKFGEFIKKLGSEFDRQTIMITHNDNLSNIADKIEVIIKE